MATLTMWAVITPVGRGGDEAAHIVKAASLWQGEVRGPSSKRVVNGQLTKADEVPVPASLSRLYEWADCPPRLELDGECDVTVPSGGLRESYTAAGPYPLAYYALVGWVTIVLDGSAAVYGMRLATALINLSFLVLAVGCVIRRANGRLGVGVLMVGLTPMAAFMMATVNPNGLELAAAAAAFAGAYCLVSSSEPRRWDLFTFTLGSVVFLSSRSLSPFFYLVGMGMILLVAGPTRVRALVAHRAVRWCGAVVALFGVAAVAWVVGQGHLGYVPGAAVPEGQSAAEQMVRLTPTYLRQIVSGFYGLDSGISNIVPFGWALFGFALLVPLVIAASRVDRIRLLGAGLLFVLLPFAIQLPTAASRGLAWHGRYIVLLVPAFGLMALYSARNSTPRPSVAVSVLGSSGLAIAMLWASFGAIEFETGTLNHIGSAVPTGPAPSWAVLLLQVGSAAIMASIAFVALMNEPRPARPLVEAPLQV